MNTILSLQQLEGDSLVSEGCSNSKVSCTSDVSCKSEVSSVAGT